MNIELLEEIRDFVVKHPRNVDMDRIEQDTAERIDRYIKGD